MEVLPPSTATAGVGLAAAVIRSVVVARHRPSLIRCLGPSVAQAAAHSKGDRGGYELCSDRRKLGPLRAAPKRSLDTAEHVLSALGPAASTLHTISRLVDRSLPRQRGNGGALPVRCSGRRGAATRSGQTVSVPPRCVVRRSRCVVRAVRGDRQPGAGDRTGRAANIDLALAWCA